MHFTMASYKFIMVSTLACVDLREVVERMPWNVDSCVFDIVAEAILCRRCIAMDLSVFVSVVTPFAATMRQSAI